MKRRVVVTGIGAVSPNGFGREAFWQATRSGISGVRRITHFDPSQFAVQIAGEVPNFREDYYVSAKDRPHVSRVTPLAIAAVSEALDDSGLNARAMSRDELRGIGVIAAHDDIAVDRRVAVQEIRGDIVKCSHNGNALRNEFGGLLGSRTLPHA